MTIKRCYHCGNPVVNPVQDHEFHQDGVYCSVVCLREEAKLLEAIEQEELDSLPNPEDFEVDDET